MLNEKDTVRSVFIAHARKSKRQPMKLEHIFVDGTKYISSSSTLYLFDVDVHICSIFNNIFTRCVRICMRYSTIHIFIVSLIRSSYLLLIFNAINNSMFKEYNILFANIWVKSWTYRYV